MFCGVMASAGHAGRTILVTFVHQWLEPAGSTWLERLAILCLTMASASQSALVTFCAVLAFSGQASSAGPFRSAFFSNGQASLMIW